MPTIQVTRSVDIPDPLRLARYRKAPELGPRVLFFTGGTALKQFSKLLINYTHNSIHLITPFDSGGSSAKLREAFNMLAVGDLRNRLMALADQSVHGHPAIYKLFAYRLPKDNTPEELQAQLDAMIRGKDAMIRRCPDPMRKLIRSHLQFFADRMPDNFDLRGASIGNLILSGGFFNYSKHIDPVIYLFSQLVSVKGMVRPVIAKDLHLGAELENGEVRIGQHLITGKETAPLDSPVKRVFISKSRDKEDLVQPKIRNKVRKLITSAELICYPIGSYYSSVAANLLPMGVGQAVSETHCPKVYVPNSTADPEQIGMSLFSSVKGLFKYAQSSCEEEVSRDKLLNFILIDSKRGNYPKPLELDKIARYGVEVIDVEMITEDSKPYLDPKLLAEHLLSLV